MGRRVVALLAGVGVAVVAVVVVVLVVVVLVLRGGPPSLPSGPGVYRLHDSATDSGGQQAPQKVLLGPQPFSFSVSVDDGSTATIVATGPMGGPHVWNDLHVGSTFPIDGRVTVVTVLDIHQGDHPSGSFVDVRIPAPSEEGSPQSR